MAAPAVAPFRALATGWQVERVVDVVPDAELVTLDGLVELVDAWRA